MAPNDRPPTKERRTDSGIEIRPVYGPERPGRAGTPTSSWARPGEYPYTRGIRPDMYRGRLWTMRQYAGFGTAESTNERFKFLLGAGQTGLSCAFDLPTQMGYDSDHPRSEGEVGKVGVAIDSLADMRLLLAGLPLDKVTTSMTINATAAILLLFYQLVAEENGVDPALLGGTIQNDILKEYVARGTYIYPPRPSMRLVTDTFSYCAEHLPSWNTISISGYHIREAGSTAVQEIAFTIANGIAYVDAALAAGLDVDAFAPRLSFFWNAHNNLFEEVAKYRAARRIWAKIMTERFGAKDAKSTLLRFHTQTGGSTLTAQQPENNIVRVTVQAMAAALGGTQSLHTNGFDEALGLPTERGGEDRPPDPADRGLRVGHRRHRRPAGRLVVRRVAHRRGGAGRPGSTSSGSTPWVARSTPSRPSTCSRRSSRPPTPTPRPSTPTRRWSSGSTSSSTRPTSPTDVFPIDAELQRSQVARVKRVRAERDQAAVDAALADVEAAARGTQNLLVPMKVALGRMATLGEVSDVLRGVFGEYHPGAERGGARAADAVWRRWTADRVPTGTGRLCPAQLPGRPPADPCGRRPR